GLSIGASFVAAVIGMIAVIVVIQPLTSVALAFGPPENFALTVIAIAFVSSLAQRSIAKGLMMAAFGLWLSTVGIDAVNGEPRFTFGILDLQDGIDLVPVLTGMFAVTEITSWIQERGTIARLGRLEGSVWRGVFDTLRYPARLDALHQPRAAPVRLSRRAHHRRGDVPAGERALRAAARAGDAGARRAAGADLPDPVLRRRLRAGPAVQRHPARDLLRPG